MKEPLSADLEDWCPVTVYRRDPPALLTNVKMTSEVRLDMDAGGWWVRDRLPVGFLRRLLRRPGWSEPYLIKPGDPLDPNREIYNRVKIDWETAEQQYRAKCSTFARMWNEIKPQGGRSGDLANTNNDFRTKEHP